MSISFMITWLSGDKLNIPCYIDRPVNKLKNLISLAQYLRRMRTL